MSPFQIGNLNNPPLNNINGALVNVDSAASIYPSFQGQKGGKINRGKINRRKINKISRKYKMKGSKRTIKRHVRRMKSRVR